MIIVEVLGGIGNQMFQYAFAKSLSRKSGKEVQLDLTGFRKYGLHSGYMLDLFPITLAPQTQSLSMFHRTIFGRVLKKMNLIPSKYVFETKLEFKEYDALAEETYYSGYFQSELYFIGIAAEVSRDFTFPELKTKYSKAAINFIESNANVVSVHVRRGDYLNKKNISIFNSLPLSYYETACEYVKETTGKELSFIVFSDDINWARDNLSFSGNSYFVEGNNGRSSIEDMALMSMCSHNIISNSTFGWWGAWLNLNPAKIVVAPREWFCSDFMSSKDIIPHKWIKL